MLENDQKSFVDFSGDWEQIFVLQKFGIMACDFENVLQSEWLQDHDINQKQQLR